MQKHFLFILVFFFAFNMHSYGQFTEVPGGKKALGITVDQANGTLWIIGDDNKIYKYENCLVLKWVYTKE